jgi:hypothetical protein
LIRVELQEPVIEGEVIEGKLHPLVPVPVETGDTKEPR